MLDMLFSSFTQLLTYYTHPFPFSHFCFHYSLLCLLKPKPFAELTSVMQIIYPPISKFIFVISFIELVWLALLKFFFFLHRSSPSNDKVSICYCLNMICMYQDFQYKSHYFANSRCD